MAIDYAGANTYFGASVHLKSATWLAVSASLRTAAVAHAKRVIARALNMTVSDLGTDTTDDDDDLPRYDAAVYEQSLWMVQQSDVSVNGEETAPKVLGAKSEGAVEQENFGWTISPEAMRFLVDYPRAIRLCRG
jgi:hypothetical protein